MEIAPSCLAVPRGQPPGALRLRHEVIGDVLQLHALADDEGAVPSGIAGG